MNGDQAAPETRGVTVTLLATVDLGPAIDGMAARHRLWAGSGLARGSKRHTLAREQRNDPSGEDLRRIVRQE